MRGLWQPQMGCYLLIGLWAPTALLAQTVTINPRIEPTNPVVGQVMRLVVEVQGVQETSDPKLPELADFRLTSTSTSTSVSIVNGRQSIAKQYAYTLIPSRPGTFTIDPIRVQYQGKTYHSQPLTFAVQERTTAQNNAASTTAYFTGSSVDKTRAYVGEQIIYTLRLYYQPQIHDVKLSGPEVEGFWAESMGEATNSAENVKGQLYRVISLQKAFYPTKPGKLTISPAYFDFHIVRAQGSRDDFFNRFFRDPFFNVGIREPVSVASQPHTIQVLPLPTAGKPSDFSGLVGSLRAQLSAPEGIREIAKGSSLTVTTELSGTINLKRDIVSEWSETTRFKRYDDKPVVSTQATKQAGNNRLLQYRSLKSAIVPLEEGELTIGPLSFSYFDPQSATYKRATTNSLNFRVTPAADEDTVTSGGFAASDTVQTPLSSRKLQRLAVDILPNHTGIETRDRQSVRLTSPFVLILLLLPLFIAIGSLAIGAASRKDPTTLRDRLRKSAAKRARQRLQVLQRTTRKRPAQDRSTYEELYTTFSEYLKERLLLPTGLVTEEELQRALQEYSLTQEKLQQVSDLLHDLEVSRLGLHSDKSAGDHLDGLIARTKKSIHIVHKATK